MRENLAGFFDIEKKIANKKICQQKNNKLAIRSLHLCTTFFMKQLFVLFFLLTNIASAQVNHPKKLTKKERFERAEKIRRERFEKERKEELERESRINKQWKSLGRHVVSVAPFSFFTEIPPQTTQGNIPYGVGISYEYFLSKVFSLQTPIFFAINSNYKKFALAIKISPKNSSEIKYAACPTFFMTTNTISDFYYDDFGFAQPQTGRRYGYGISFDNSLNFIASRKFYLTLSAGPGITIIEEKKYKHQSLAEIYAGYKEAPDRFITFNYNFLIGYRF